MTPRLVTAWRFAHARKQTPHFCDLLRVHREVPDRLVRHLEAAPALREKDIDRMNLRNLGQLV